MAATMSCVRSRREQTLALSQRLSSGAVVVYGGEGTRQIALPNPQLVAPWVILLKAGVLLFQPGLVSLVEVVLPGFECLARFCRLKRFFMSSQIGIATKKFLLRVDFVLNVRSSYIVSD